jgi:hypothetical protein
VREKVVIAFLAERRKNKGFLTCPENGQKTPGSGPLGKGKDPYSPLQVCMEMMQADKQLSRGARPGHDKQDVGPRQMTQHQCFMRYSWSLFLL